jgi:hypothetical protein
MAELHTGINLGAWIAFTPSWTNLTVGNASINSGAYCQVGKVVVVRFNLKFGNTSSLTNM